MADWTGLDPITGKASFTMYSSKSVEQSRIEDIIRNRYENLKRQIRDIEEGRKFLHQSQ